MMGTELAAQRLLKSAEEELRQVVHSFIGAEPAQLTIAQRLLERMVSTLCELEASVRQSPSLPVRDSLLGVQNQLRRAAHLSRTGLDMVERHPAIAGIPELTAKTSFHIDA